MYLCILHLCMLCISATLTSFCWPCDLLLASWCRKPEVDPLSRHFRPRFKVDRSQLRGVEFSLALGRPVKNVANCRGERLEPVLPTKGLDKGYASAA